MATTTTPSSTPSGSVPARLLSDPNSAVCPDFASEDYDEVRAKIDAVDGIAIAKLTASWTKSNDKKKAQWIIQVEADRAQADAEEAVRRQEAEKEAAEAAKAAEAERLEAEKKKPKLGDFDVNSAPTSFIEARISAFAQKKLERREYCPLYPFTTAGLSEAAAAIMSSAEDGSSVRLGRSDDNELTFQTGPSANTHKNMVRDENLSHREFGLGWHRYIKEIGRADWPKLHVNALTQFFYGLDTHALHEQEHGSQIIRIYADRYRLEWFNTLGTANSFNIAIINDGLLTKITNEYFMKLHSKTIVA
ncbi:hypothetical protein C8F04DRAFT_1390291 [Mycena alexandri]|uniref:Uncharacterized protein n=1 Tax=Mycena alexandri TaxID=1745969 RepID=A0AAD6TFB0_9AGAR|nr:hypothetical protein C8F04DRAFT_1390291 [Mycena alexandri]